VPNHLLLTDGKSPSLPSHYAGALRIRALPPGPAPAAFRHPGEVGVVLEVTPEPRLPWRNVFAVRVRRAVDDKGQELAQVSDLSALEDPEGLLMANMVAKVRFADAGPALAGLRHEQVRLRQGERESLRLVELSGTLAGQVQTAQQPLLTVSDVLKAAGKTVKGKQGGLLKVEHVNRTESGEITLRVRLEVPPDATVAAVPAFGNAARLQALQARQLAAAQVQLQMRGAQGGSPARSQTAFAGLTLHDAKGQPLPLLQAQVNPQGEYVLTFRPRPDQAEADKLVFSGSRTVTVEVPFTLRDVPVR
jgi:hypothetical protein